MTIAITKLNESQQDLLNDDHNKPRANKISKRNQGYRFFLEWHISIEFDNEVLNNTVDWIIANSKVNLQQRSIANFRKLAEVVLLNLGKSLIQCRWLQIHKRKSQYDIGTVPHSLGFSLRHLNSILNCLAEHELIYVVKGAKYKQDPQLSAYQPTELFDIRLSLLAMNSVSNFDVDLVRVNKQEGEITALDIEQINQDTINLTTINNYLKNHTYPFKGPMKRVYSKKVGLSGRIYCDYQQITSRRLPLRQESLIDGVDVVEIDICSSHPRIAIQEFYGECISATFYQDIVDELNIFKPKVKKYFQVALSSGNRFKAFKGFLKEGYDRCDFEALESWVQLRYPKVPLYSSWSLEAMNHEGELLLRVMLRGVKDDKVVLPVHDAIAVKKVDEEWAVRALKETWLEYFGYDYCLVSSK